MKQFLFFILLFLIFSISAHAKSGHARLVPSEIERVKVVKQMLYEVDKKSLQQTIEELEKTGYPDLYVYVREAMAKTYLDIVREQDVQSQKAKEWLYSMITLNMAYLQLGGTHNAEVLNRQICQKLKAYLPADILNRPGINYSME